MQRALTLSIAFASICLAFPTHDSHAYLASSRWGHTATNGNTSAEGTPITLTWSFVEDGTPTSDGTSDLIGYLDEKFGAGPGGTDYTLRPWFDPFQQSFNRFGELSGLTYIYQPEDDGSPVSGSKPGNLSGPNARGDVRISGLPQENLGVLAFNYFPDYGDMVFNTNNADFGNSSNDFRFIRNTTMHEAMHGVGISHVESSNAGFLIEPALSTAFDGPQLDDLLALHRLYGDVLEKDGGNNSVATATPLGLITREQMGIIGTSGSGTVIGRDETDFVSIDDNSDTDFFSFTIDQESEVNVELIPRGAVYQIGPQDGTQSTYNSVALSDLSMFLFDSSFNLVGQGNSNPIGTGEIISTQLQPDTYYVRVAGANDDVQLYQLSVESPGAPLDLVWTGDLSSGWSVDGQANFSANGNPFSFAILDNVLFDDTATRKIIGLIGNIEAGDLVFDATSEYTLQGSGSITSGSVTLDGTGTVAIRSSGNSYSGPTQVNAGTLKLTGNIEAMQTAITIEDGGAVVLRPTVAGSTGISLNIQPGGELHIGEQGEFSSPDVFPDNPTGIVNNGLIRVFGSESIRDVTGTGGLNIEENTTVLGSGNTFDGQLTIFDGALAVVEDSQGLGSSIGGTEVQSGGALRVNANVTIEDDLSLGGSGNASANGALSVNNVGTATFTGVLTVVGPSATVQAEANTTAQFSGGIDTSSVGGELTFHTLGTIKVNGPVQLGSGGLRKTGTGGLDIADSLASAGPLLLEDGNTALSGSGEIVDIVHLAPTAELHLTGNHTWQSTSTMSGSGTVYGDLETAGTLSPSEQEQGNPIGALHLTQNLTLGATSILEFQIGGTSLGEFDQLLIDGVAALDGTLRVEMIDLGEVAYSPQLGDSFTLISTQGGTSGAFDSLELPTLDEGLLWALNSGAAAISLDVVAESLLAADFDSNGIVDGLDLAAWKTGYGLAMNATRPDGEATGDGAVSGSDFLVWQSQFSPDSGTPTPGTSVPEPTSIVLTYLATLALTCLRIRTA